MGRLQSGQGMVTSGLLFATVYSALYVVAAAGWGDRVAAAPLAGLIGAIVGLMAAKSRLRAPWALLLSTGIGAEAILIIQAAMSPGPSWGEKLAAMSDSLWGWYYATITRGASHDPAVFGFFLNAVGYLLGLCSAWFVFRMLSGWGALVLIGAAGVVHLSYVSVDSVPRFLVSLFVGALLVASLELQLRQRTWRAIGVHVQPSSTAWTLTAAGSVVGLSLVAAFQLPAGDIKGELATGLQMLTEPMTGFQGQVDRLAGGGRGPQRPGRRLVTGQSLVPRQFFNVGTQPVLRVTSPQPAYWTGVTYDRYTGRSIEQGDTTEQRYEPGQELPADPEGGQLRLGVEQNFTILAPSVDLLYAADSPLSFGMPVSVEERQVSWDLATNRPPEPVQRGQSYYAMSKVSLAGRQELAAAAAVYPTWAEHYLELPETFPPRVGELAREVAASSHNPLERALALESYLRGFTYSTRVDVPPAERDWVDYLLFDSKSGYCDYFATALAMMLRTQGIPARVATGFAPGTLEEEHVWLVRESDAHSWTQAYFPGYGWLPFEPSAVRPLPERPESVADSNAAQSGRSKTSQLPHDPGEDFGDDAGAGEEETASSRVEPTPIGAGLLALALLVIMLGIGLVLLALVWDRGLSTEPAARRRYAHLRRLLGWGKADAPDSATPLERAEWVTAQLPWLAEPVGRLVRCYVEATYGKSVSPSSAAESEAAWQTVRRPLWVAMLRRRLGGRGPEPMRPRRDEIWQQMLRRRQDRRARTHLSRRLDT